MLESAQADAVGGASHSGGTDTLGGTSQRDSAKAIGGTSQITDGATCAPAKTLCGEGTLAQCVDRMSDHSNCGACGNVCEAETPCVEGRCRPPPCEGTVALGGLPMATVGGNPFSLVIGDLNGDRHQDLVTANRDSSSVTVLLGKGDGTFANGQDYAVGSEPTFVALGDLNGDGDLDLASANVGSDSVSVLSNKGDGTFVHRVDYATGTKPISVTLVDLNGDNRLDLVAANGESSSVSVRLAADDGTFSSPVNHAVDGSPSALVTGDLNGGGKPDLAVANQLPTKIDAYSNKRLVTVLPGVGDGSFAAPLDQPIDCDETEAIFLGDLNADGKLDLAVGCKYANFGGVFLGNGDGTFAAKGEFESGGSTSGMTMGDVTGDGRLDIVTGEELATPGGQRMCSNRAVNVIAGASDGSFAPSVAYPAGGFPNAVAVGDLNGDGWLDIAAASGSVNAVSALLGPKFTAGSASSEAGVSLPAAVVVGDFDADGRLDVASGGYMDGLTLRIGNGAGGFKEEVKVIADIRPTMLVVGDLNADGLPDLVAAGGYAEPAEVLLGLGAGKFAAAVPYEIPGEARAAALGDFNGDGALDLALSINSPNRVSVVFGTGKGSFADEADYPMVDKPDSMAAGDLNGDGRSDLIVGISGADRVRAMFGAPDGTWFDEAEYETGNHPTSVVIANFNGDAWPDFATANLDETISVYLGIGKGVFGKRTDYATGTYMLGQLLAGDLNGDGLADLLASRGFSGFSSVLYAAGDGTFGNVQHYVGEGHESGALADFDGDGRLDLIAAGCNLKVHLNRCQ